MALLTGFDHARQILEQRFATLWTYTPIKWDNVALEPEPTINDEWTDFNIVPNISTRSEIAHPKPVRRDYGLLKIIIHTPEGTGTGRLYELIDNCVSIFDCYQEESLEIEDHKTIGPLLENGWYNMTLIFEYRFDK